MADQNWNTMWGIVIMMLVPAYLVLQIGLGITLRGRWRIAALAPLAAFVPILVYSVFALAQGSNLWPLLAILFAPIGFVYLVALLLVRPVLGRKAAS
jgi:hypothetical protein